MAPRQKPAQRGAREKILTAAAELAKESGPGSLSLDAVARHAGVSKGGLLYHFPSKAALMQGLLEDYLQRFEQTLRAAVTAAGDEGEGEAARRAYVAVALRECEEKQPSLSWLIAAISADPDFFSPIKAFNRRLLDWLKDGADDPDGLLVTFLALEGLRSLRLFDADILSEEEHRQVAERLLGGTADREG